MARTSTRRPWTLQGVLILLACVWVASASVAPDVLSFGPVRLRFEDLVAAVMALVLFARMVRCGVRRGSLGVVQRVVYISCGFGIMGLLALSITYAGGIPFAETGTQSFRLIDEVLKEYVRFGKYTVVALVFGGITFRGWKPIMAIFVACCIAIVAIQVMQFMGIGGVAGWVENTYNYDASSSEVSQEGAREAGYWKSGSVMVQPNVLGMFLVLPQLLFVMMFLRSRDRRTAPPRPHSLFWFFVSCLMWFGIFMTQSLTAAVATIFGLCVASLFIPWPSRIRLYTALLVLLTLIVLAVILVFGGALTKFSSAGVERGLTEGSLGIKIANTMAALDQLGVRVVVGAGPANTLIMADTEIGYITIWYGVIGLCMLLVFYKSLCCLMWVRIKDVYTRAAFLGTVAAFLPGAVGASCFVNNRVFPVFIALLSAACSAEIGRRRASVPEGKASRVVEGPHGYGGLREAEGPLEA